MGTPATHLSYQVSVFRVDQDHGSQPLEEGEGFIELRRKKQAVRQLSEGKRRPFCCVLPPAPAGAATAAPSPEGPA